MNLKVRFISALFFLFTITAALVAGGRGVSIFTDGGGYLSPGVFTSQTSKTTVEFWAFRDEWKSLNNEVMLSFLENGGWEFQLKKDNVQLTFYLNGSLKTLAFPSTGLTNGWHHFAFTFDGNYLRFYIDGYQRGFTFSFKSTLTQPAQNTWLVVSAAAATNGVGGQYFNGIIDEVRVWGTALSATELRDWIHTPITESHKPSYINQLILYYPFDSLNVFADYSTILSSFPAYDIVFYDSVNVVEATVPMANQFEGFINQRALWTAFVQGTFSEPSGGLNLGVKNYDEFESGESIIFGHNNQTGILNEKTAHGVDLQANRVWYVDSNHDTELPTFRFQLFEAGVGALYYGCLPTHNYKLLYKPLLEDTFRIIADGATIDGNLLYFNNVLCANGYYSIGRKNDVPTVFSAMEVTGITAESALFGGSVGCDGGAEVSAFGVCWNTSGSPDISDSLTTDGSGTGDFTSFISNLEPGRIYYTRAYASNSCGTAYGEELVFQTTKKYQSITFPAIPTVVYGKQDFSPGAYASSGLPITYTSSNKEVAEIVNGKIHIKGTGTSNIWAYQPGNTGYSPTTYKKAVLTVEKAPLTIKANSYTIFYGESIPQPDYIIEGFVYNESLDVFNQLPLITSELTDTSCVGSYPLIVFGGSAGNYNLAYEHGSITILKSVPEVTEWPSPTPILYGDPLYNSLLEGGQGCISGSFIFNDSTYVPVFCGEEVEVVFQPCDTLNFNIVKSKVAIMLDVATNTGNKYLSNFKIYPNPATSFISISGVEPGSELKIYDSSGRVIRQMRLNNMQIDLTQLTPGIYLIETIRGKAVFMKH